MLQRNQAQHGGRSQTARSRLVSALKAVAQDVLTRPSLHSRDCADEHPAAAAIMLEVSMPGIQQLCALRSCVLICHCVHKPQP